MEVSAVTPAFLTVYLLSTLMKPKTISTNLYAIFMSFSAEIWILIAISYFILSILNCKLVYQNLKKSLLYYFSTILLVSIPNKFFNKCQRIILAIWCFAAFFFGQFFGNELLANLSVESKFYINNWRELNNSDYSVLVCKSAFA